MKKLFLLLIVCASALTLSAQVFVENFATATSGSDLEGYNGWYKCLKAGDDLGVSPKIAEGALFYTGYYGSNVGNACVLDSAIGITSANQRISTRAVVFANGDTLKPIEGQKIYAAFIVNFSQHSVRSFRDFFTFEGSKTTSSTRGRVFAKLNAAGTDLYFAVSKNSSTAGTYVESSVITAGVGINHLLVLCYDGIAGASNDVISLYIDPDLSLPEAQQTNKLTATDISANTDYSVTVPFRINLRQRGTGAQIGGIRVGTSWNSVLLGAGTGISQLNRDYNGISSFGKTIVTNGVGNVRVFNLAGSEIFSAQTTGKLVTTLNNGLYIVRFTSIDGKTGATKVQLD